MKIFNITILLCFFTFLNAYAQLESKLEKALKPIIQDLENAGAEEELKQVVNKLERISQAESSDWLPTYHLGYAYLSMAMRSSGSDADGYLKKTQEQLDKLHETQPKNSEVLSLQAFKHIIYMVQDQGTRAREFVPKINEILKKAIDLDPNNPRAFLLSGQMMYNGALFFKTSTAEACTMIDRSLQLFADQNEDTIMPIWGKKFALESQEKCEEGQSLNE